MSRIGTRNCVRPRKTATQLGRQLWLNKLVGAYTPVPALRSVLSEIPNALTSRMQKTCRISFTFVMLMSNVGHRRKTSIAYVCSLFLSISIATLDAIEVIVRICSLKIFRLATWSFLVLSVLSLIVCRRRRIGVGIAFNNVALHSALCSGQCAL